MSTELSFIDRHCVRVSASPDTVWVALAQTLTRGFGGAGKSLFARILGCDDVAVKGSPLAEGSTVVGFHVTETQPERRVVLAGRHRFSRYPLTFEFDGRTLCATTHAEFPGYHGALYKLLVVGSGGHVLVVRRLLVSTQRRSEELSRSAPS